MRSRGDVKTGSGFVAYLREFEHGDDALLILANYETIDWLMSQFGRLSDTPIRAGYPSFVIGDGNPVESDGQCLITVDLGNQTEGGQLVRQSENTFNWSVSRRLAHHYRELLSGMFEPKPGHQYLDDESRPEPVVIVSRDEYDADWVRRMKLRNEAK